MGREGEGSAWGARRGNGVQYLRVARVVAYVVALGVEGAPTR